MKLRETSGLVLFIVLVLVTVSGALLNKYSKQKKAKQIVKEESVIEEREEYGEVEIYAPSSPSHH